MPNRYYFLPTESEDNEIISICEQNTRFQFKTCPFKFFLQKYQNEKQHLAFMRANKDLIALSVLQAFAGEFQAAWRGRNQFGNYYLVKVMLCVWFLKMKGLYKSLAEAFAHRVRPAGVK